MKRNTTTNHFFKHGEVEIGNLKLYDHDVSYLQDTKNKQAGYINKNKQKMFVDILVYKNEEETDLVLPTDLRQLEELLGTEIDRNYENV